MKAKQVGESIKRNEDFRLVTGRGRYVADVRLLGVLHAAILRSPYAHSRVVRIDASKAKAVPGVFAVFTSEDLGPVQPIPVRIAGRPGLTAGLQPPLAPGVVRYVGEPVSVVVASDRYVAEDALELIDIEFEELPVVADAWQAVAPGAPQLHAGVPGNVVERFEQRVGDIEEALALSDLRLSQKFAVQRHTAVPLETRGVLAAYDPGTRLLTVWGPTKAVHFTRRVLSDLLGHPEHLIAIHCVDVGGGFGVRGEFYPEDFLISWAAMRLERPVQWIEDRREHFIATNHSRQQYHDVEIGVRRDGKIIGLVDRIVVDIGAYLRTNGLVPARLGAAMLPGPYKLPNLLCEVSCVFTNKTPTGTYRGPGRYETTFVRERLVDVVAGELGLDPADVRRRNFVQSDDMPYAVGTSALNQPIVYDSGDYSGAFETALAMVDYKALRSEQEGLRQQGRYLGIGLGCVVEKSGLGPWESARVEVDGSGRPVVYTGVSALGTGLETVLAQICADELGIEARDVSVIMSDTTLTLASIGGGASRGTVMAGNAVLEASRAVRAKILTLAADFLEAHVDDLVIEGGCVRVRGVPATAVTFRDLARAATPRHQALPKKIEPGLSASAFFEASHMVYPYGTHIAVVEVDPDTGEVRILKYVIAYDVGRAINPMIVEGQLLGGLAQGIGGALLEDLTYDERAQLLTTSFMDYLLPTVAEMPIVTMTRILEDAPSPLNPLGVKGAGEGGSTGAGAAIANAVADALAPFGIKVSTLPLSPGRILGLLGGL